MTFVLILISIAAVVLPLTCPLEPRQSWLPFTLATLLLSAGLMLKSWDANIQVIVFSVISSVSIFAMVLALLWWHGREGKTQMMARTWTCPKCGYTNWSSFSQGRCDNPDCGNVEPDIIHRQELEHHYVAMQRQLVHERLMLANYESRVARTLDQINGLKREMAQLDGHRPRDELAPA